MSYISSKIELYKRLGDQEGNWDSTAIDVTGFFNKNIKIGNGTKKDTFKFSLLNNYNKYYRNGPVIEQGDKILIYQKLNSTSFDTDDILIDGLVVSITNDNSPTRILTVAGKNRTEMFLEGLTFVSSPTVEMSPAEILEECLVFHNRNNQNFTITWDSNNPTLKSDGVTAFPTYLIETFYQPMYSTFEKYSSSTYTKDGNYYYYIDLNNNLIWQKMTSDASGSLNETDCNTFKIMDSEQGIVNSLIINCGYTPYGKPIRTYSFDYASRAKNGAKWKYYTKSNTIASDLIKSEESRGISDFAGTKFPDSGDYPYTTGWGAVATSDESWNTVIREEATRKGKIEGTQFLQYNNQTRIKIDCVIPFSEAYTINSVLTCTFPSHNIIGVPLRITDIQYTDYTTSLTLLEDVEV